MLTKSNKKTKFDIVIPMPHEAIYACYFQQVHELGMIVTESRTKMSIQCMYEILGHWTKKKKEKS